ncbi:Thymidylate kinase [Tepidimonas thermarum]|uniref:Thymidylate kinase n=1 Tax=Tepidimonas thermarum TaxID=335431 RepID=A0A554X023_9BURK|nr:dTMP kinase [Tepidimonas thermarum]TSE29191.1 Thymidylate kinase [Tepidimonas thermarum]
MSVVAPPATGLFITFEGIDGAGKSTHITALADALRHQGYAVTVTREPGGTPLAEELRACLLHTGMDALTEALLMFAARRDHLVRVIEPALLAGGVVLCDRFTDATFAYQGHGRGFDLGILRTLEGWVQTTPSGWRQPDMTLWFDVPPAVAAARLAGARAPDKFESEPQAFFERVAAGYAQRAQEAPQRIVRIDAALDVPAVWQQVQDACRQRGWLP